VVLLLASHYVRTEPGPNRRRGRGRRDRVEKPTQLAVLLQRAGRKHSSRLWTKLTVACDTNSHFFAGATVATGPSNDSPQFRPVLTQASLAVAWDRVLADAAFDSEEYHRYCRGISGAVHPDPLEPPGQGRKWPKAQYRATNGQTVRKKPKESAPARCSANDGSSSPPSRATKRRSGDGPKARVSASAGFAS